MQFVAVKEAKKVNYSDPLGCPVFQTLRPKSLKKLDIDSL